MLEVAKRIILCGLPAPLAPRLPQAHELHHEDRARVKELLAKKGLLTPGEIDEEPWQGRAFGMAVALHERGSTSGRSSASR